MYMYEPHESKSIAKATSEKFDGKDFTDWKFEMMRALEVAGLQDVVLGVETAPTDPALLKKWKRKNVIALSALSMNTTRKVHPHINDKEFARDAWDSLHVLREDNPGE